MFHNVSPAIRAQMMRLEEIDTRDRVDGTPHSERMRQIPPETGRFLAILAANAPEGDFVEIGTSAAYSTLWLALACLATGRKITTFELLEGKAKLAAETIHAAQLEGVIHLVVGDTRHNLPGYKNISFCFLDAEKEVYSDCYETVVPNMVTGGLLVADNAISHKESLQPMIDRALADDRVDALVVPIGKGVLVCRKV